MSDLGEAFLQGHQWLQDNLPTDNGYVWPDDEVRDKFFEVFKDTMHTRRLNGEPWGEYFLFEELCNLELIVRHLPDLTGNYE